MSKKSEKLKNKIFIPFEQVEEFQWNFTEKSGLIIWSFLWKTHFEKTIGGAGGGGGAQMTSLELLGLKVTSFCN